MAAIKIKQKFVSKVQVENTVNLAVMVVNLPKVEKEIEVVRSKFDRFRDSLQSSGLGGLDISESLSGGGLFKPFLDGIQLAIAAEDEAAKNSVKNRELPTSDSGIGETQANLNALKASVASVSLEIGNALLPAVNAIAVALVPLITQVASFLAQNPQLVQGVAAGVLAFNAIRAAITGVEVAMQLLKSGFLTSPIGLAAMAIALAAGLIIANWDSISAFFAKLWEGIKALAAPVIDFFKTLFSWTPLGMIVSNWQPLVGLFSAVWDLLVALAQPVLAFFRTLFDWSPVGMVVANWEPISEAFATLWEGLKAITAPVFDVLHGLFDWSPLGMIIKHWEPITEWFGKMWEKLKDIFGSVKEMLGGTVAGFIGKVTGTVEGVTEKQEQINGFFGWGKDEEQPKISADLPQSSSALLQQSVINNRAQLEGGLTVRFENAPLGMRADAPHSNQPNLQLTSLIGYRSLSLGGSHDGQLA